MPNTIYVKHAGLRPGDYFFAGPRFIVDSTLVSNTMKAAAFAAGLSPARTGLHSLRVGGSVSLFAAGAPAHLMTLAGRAMGLRIVFRPVHESHDGTI
jgi:hypothetical protein